MALRVVPHLMPLACLGGAAMLLSIVAGAPEAGSASACAAGKCTAESSTRGQVMLQLKTALSRHAEIQNISEETGGGLQQSTLEGIGGRRRRCCSAGGRRRRSAETKARRRDCQWDISASHRRRVTACKMCTDQMERSDCPSGCMWHNQCMQAYLLDTYSTIDDCPSDYEPITGESMHDEGTCRVTMQYLGKSPYYSPPNSENLNATFIPRGCTYVKAVNAYIFNYGAGITNEPNARRRRRVSNHGGDADTQIVCVTKGGSRRRDDRRRRRDRDGDP